MSRGIAPPLPAVANAAARASEAFTAFVDEWMSEPFTVDVYARYLRANPLPLPCGPAYRRRQLARRRRTRR